MKNKTYILMIIMAVAIFLSACTGQEKADGQGIEIEHSLGRTRLKENPGSIVVFDYASLDNLRALGYADRVVGLPKESLPAYLEEFNSQDYTNTGSLKEPNFESIYKLAPELIIIGDRQAKHYEEFSQLAPTILLSSREGDYMDLLRKNLESLGQIFASKDQASKLFKDLDEEVLDLGKKAELKQGKTLFLMANDGELKAHGRGSRFSLIYDNFGLSPVDENLEASNHGQKINFEYILDKDPDYILVMDRTEIAGGNTSAKQSLDNKIIRQTSAYKNQNIFYVNSPVWYVAAGGIEATRYMMEDVHSLIN